MGDTVGDIDIKIEQKDKKTDIFENETVLPGSKVNEEMNKLGLNEISSKRKGYRNMDRMINSLNNHKFVKNKSKKNENF